VLLATYDLYGAVAPPAHPRLLARQGLDQRRKPLGVGLPARRPSLRRSLRPHCGSTPAIRHRIAAPYAVDLGGYFLGRALPLPPLSGPAPPPVIPEAAVDVAPEALQPQGAHLPTPLHRLQGLPGIPTPPSGAYGLRTRRKASADLRSRAWTATLRTAQHRHGTSRPYGRPQAENK
jgi:hypothetical protein